jgi:hypothetical protein
MTSLLFYPGFGPAVLTLAESKLFIMKYDKLKRGTTVYLFTVKIQLNSSICTVKLVAGIYNSKCKHTAFC